jgi:predicted O-methyltransferase YrrM
MGDVSVDILDPNIHRYLDSLARSEDPLLEDMERLAEERGFPIVGPQVGRLLFVLARAAKARRILELGSGFGYSAIWLARAAGPNGEVVLTERSSERAREAERFLLRAGLSGRCRVEIGDALDILERIEGPFDLIFNDTDKEHYGRVLEPAAARLRPGGLFVSDNMLWFGKVLEPSSDDPATRGVVELTRKLFASPRFATVILPVRDGVSVSVLLDSGRAGPL